MFELFSAPEYLPFTVALVLMIMIGLVEAAGLGAAAVELDVDVDIQTSANPLGWLGVGAVPLLVLIVTFLALFALAGVAIQQIAAALLGNPLSGWLAAPAATLVALPLLGGTARAASRIMPKDETTAVSRNSLIGRRATITIGVAQVGSPARATVRDVHDQVHHVMVEPSDERTAVPEGQSLLLVRRVGDVFIGLAEGEPLTLTLEHRASGLFR